MGDLYEIHVKREAHLLYLRQVAKAWHFSIGLHGFC